MTVQSQGGEIVDYPALVRRIGAGDRAAEAEFAAHFYPGVRSLVRRQARPNDPAVDDLVQIVLQSVLEQLRERSPDDSAALGAYVRSTVVHTVRAEYRKRARRGLDRPAESPDVLVDADTPDRRAERAELVRIVVRLLAEMPVPRDRELLRLHFIEERDRHAICLSLGIDAEHFRRVLFRARDRFRQLARAAGLHEAPDGGGG